MTTTRSAPETHPTVDTRSITDPRIRPFLLLDASLTAANGLAYLIAAPWLAAWFGTSSGLLRGLGLALLVIGAAVAHLATRRPVPCIGVLELAIFNAIWVLASLAYAALGDLTAPGVVWDLVQAALVAGFAGVQLWFARRG